MALARPSMPFVERAFFRPAHRGQSGSLQEIEVPRTTQSGMENYVHEVKKYNQELRNLVDFKASLIPAPLPIQPMDIPSKKFCYDVQIDMIASDAAWFNLVRLCKTGSGGIHSISCTSQCKPDNTLFVDTFDTPTPNAPHSNVVHLGIRLTTDIPILLRAFLLTTPHVGRIAILPLQHKDTFNMIALPAEIQLDILYRALELSEGQTELIDGGVVENGTRKPGRIVDERFPVSKAQDRANILLALKVVFPQEMEKYFGKEFKFGSTSDFENFLRGIGPVGRRMLRYVKICSWLQASGQAVFRLLKDAENLQRLHITAICIGEAGCRTNHSRKAIPTHILRRSRPGTWLFNQFAIGLRRKAKKSRRRMVDLLSQRDILTFDKPVIAYGKEFGDYLEDGNVETSGRAKWIATPRDARDFVDSMVGLGVRCRILEE